MRKYEIMFIVNPTLEEAKIKSVAEDVKNILTSNNSKITDEKDMGQKELAYEIKGHKNGYYFLYTVEANNDAIDAFNHFANTNENIIRKLIVKVED